MNASPQVNDGNLEAGDGLEVLLPQTFEVPFGSRAPGGIRVLQVGPILVDRIPVLVRQARPLIEAVLELSDDASEDLMALCLDLMASQGDELIKAVAIAAGEPLEFIQKGTLEEFTALAFKVFEVNRDFFTRILGPLLARAASKRASVRGAGPIVSSA